MDNNKPASPVIPKEYLVPFLLLASCFALWGLLNNMTDNLVPAFKEVFDLTNARSTWVQVAFYGAYAVAAIPAALLIKRFSFKTGVLVGLSVYIIGALGYIPSSMLSNYYLYLTSIFILAAGLSVLETSCNPYVISMGEEETSVRRLNTAQAFNPLGSLTGLFLGKYVILSNIASYADKKDQNAEVLEKLRENDLFWLSAPYVGLAIIAAIIWIAICKTKMPEGSDHDHHTHPAQSLKRLLSHPRYYWGVITQFFYVGVQITVWTYTIAYITSVIPGMPKEEAANYGIIALVIFTVARMICTYLMKYFNPANMMAILAVLGMVLSYCVVYLPAPISIWCLISISGCMSLMFPTIYGIALRGLGGDAKFGASGLIMAILGGALIPLFHATVADWLQNTKLIELGHEALSRLSGDELKKGAELMGATTQLQIAEEFAWRTSFWIPVVCFAVVLIYSIACRNSHKSVTNA